MSRRTRLAMFVCLATLPFTARGEDEPKTPKRQDFLLIPLRVHVLKAKDLPEVHCGLSDADVKRIVGKINGVWQPAGIHFGLESIVREDAAEQEKFRLARDLDGNKARLGLFRLLLPEPSRKFDGLHVYYIHKFSVNGVFMGDDFAIVQETSKLREVKGGIDEPLPRVTAHELGHALGLIHRQDRTNLLASGTTGTSLNSAEIDRARSSAKKAAAVSRSPNWNARRRKRSNVGNGSRKFPKRKREKSIAKTRSRDGRAGYRKIQDPRMQVQ